jgi:peptidoglycan/xylan/chitin deacetylase (PgdA/CDA1 family)
VGATAGRHAALGRVVALTVDDGPSRTYTPAVLATLERHGAHATFFLVGQSALSAPDLVRAEIAQGSEVGVHTMTHPDMARLTPAETGWQIDEAKSAIEQITGAPPVFFRPPRGVRTPAANEVATRAGLRVVLWDECLDHAADVSAQAAADRVLAQVRPGDVVLVHDGLGHRERGLAALDILLTELGSRGYRVVTLSELFGPAR